MLVALPVLLSTVALAGGGLRLDAAPVRLGPGRYAFSGVALDVLPGVLLRADGDAAVPAGARPLGGPSWLLAVEDADAAVALALQLDRRPGLTAFPDVRLERRRASDGDPLREGQWYLDHLDIAPLHAVSMGSAEVRVAVIDSGIDVDHPDLSAAVWMPYDAHGDDDDPSPDPGEYCFDGRDDICDEHGTAVAGVMVARADNGVGMVGLCPACTLVPIKLLGDGAGAASADIAAFEHAIAQDVGVINNSWGYTRPVAVPGVLADVIERAAVEPRGGRGALVVFAAGNDDREVEPDELQALDTVLCVTATDSYGRYTNYTNYGEPVDIAAPSATVSIAPDNGSTTTFGGTSAAAPVVSGLAGWALSLRPELTADALREVLLDTARPSPLVTHDERGHHPYYGYGEVDPAALLSALQAPAEPVAGEAAGGCSSAGRLGASGVGLVLGLGLVAGRRRR